MATINLVKGQKINLKKENGASITKFCAGANWGAHSNGDSIDLDLHGVMFDSNKNEIEHIYFGNRYSEYAEPKRHEDGYILESKIWLTEDDREGDQGGDDGEDNEVLYMDLSKLPSHCEKVVIFLCSFSGDDFGDVPHAAVRIYEGTKEHPTNILAQYNVGREASFRGHTVMVMGMFYKHNGEWKFNAIGTPIKVDGSVEAKETIKSKFL
jgi:tellurium resistance protein TerZ